MSPTFDQVNSWSQRHVFSVYLRKEMKTLDEGNQTQHEDDAEGYSGNIV